MPANTEPFNPNDHLMDLKGKSYLQVAHRLLWLNEDLKAGSIGGFEILTELMSESTWTDDKRKREVKEVVFRATIEITDTAGDVVKRVTGWGSETDVDFGDYREKAETKAIGRAVALAGYGTQHAPEFDEGERSSPILDADGNRGPIGPGVVDAPVKVAAPAPATRRTTTKAMPAKPTASPTPPQSPPKAAATTKDPMGDSPSKEEILRWLKDHVKEPHVSDLLRETLASNSSGNKVSDLPEELLRRLYVTANTLSQPNSPAFA
jgi:hypothetical protein